MSKIDISTTLIDRLLGVLQDDILPLTETGVQAGNKIFGAALLRKSDLSCYLAETNNEIQSPLHHGEMHLLKRYHEQDEQQRATPQELIFLSTHEPCSMCLSAITWAGFDNFIYYFSHENSRDEFAIPHDLKILKEVFNVNPGEYRKHNDFWNSYSVSELINSLRDVADANHQHHWQQQTAAINKRYENASSVYQQSKTDNRIPLN